MKKELSDKARKAMSAGGKKASKTAKSNAGKKGFEALIAKTVAKTLNDAGVTPATS